MQRVVQAGRGGGLGRRTECSRACCEVEAPCWAAGDRGIRVAGGGLAERQQASLVLQCETFAAAMMLALARHAENGCGCLSEVQLAPSAPRSPATSSDALTRGHERSQSQRGYMGDVPPAAALPNNVGIPRRCCSCQRCSTSPDAVQRAPRRQWSRPSVRCCCLGAGSLARPFASKG